jgi:hypothetical protein
MRVHANLTYGAFRYRVLGDVTSEEARALRIQIETANGNFVSLPAVWVDALNTDALAAITAALRSVISAGIKRMPTGDALDMNDGTAMQVLEYMRRQAERQYAAALQMGIEAESVANTAATTAATIMNEIAAIDRALSALLDRAQP